MNQQSHDIAIPRRSFTKDFVVLVLLILVCQAAGAIGAFTTDTGQSAWYQSLRKPSFNPPAWVFGPVWIALYTLMGFSAFLVWRRGWDLRFVRTALVFFFFQLILNAVWTPVFFGAKQPLVALLIIVVLWFMILMTIVLFHTASRVAAWLLVPYLLWVGFATVLNAAIVHLND